ncbi:endolytic transglycosylase MltG (plasmid) [Nocardia sp. NBC_01503]|uniref:endolytic transglycosylase MltG n=1 Tax=Nocardia sp. NBC_01503 TaxID=2975997 RepID=UPI002E7BE777|nr:endolytic transglycosylase MltG [Nocardia sp. NBC_01503]WTL36645.1 endolytic transglycosylase MltG [Nocardia sp. NBC_01503]
MNNQDRRNTGEPDPETAAQFKALIEQSSLGGELAQAMRKRISAEDGQRLAARAEETINTDTPEPPIPADGGGPAQWRRRNLVFIQSAAAAVVLILTLAVVLLGGHQPTHPADFAGPEGPTVVVWIPPAASRHTIADILRQQGVVASSAAFDLAVQHDPAFGPLPAGYYAVPSHSSADAAAATLVGGHARVGNVVIDEGRALLDEIDENTDDLKEGIYHKIAEASCIRLGARASCLTYEQLMAAGATDPEALGVPAWALAQVRAAPDRGRALEGLIAAGSWDFDPTASPQQVIKELVTKSIASYEASGLLRAGASNGLTPYETLIAASLVERESLPLDMSKVARVILNRIKVDQPLNFDSTVNYGLARTEVATTGDERTHRTPWNTYAMTGLPVTPIAAFSPQALHAMENPTPGDWLYFVTIDKQGTTLFTDTYAEYLHDVDIARQSGMLPSN